ncbi:MAG: GTPase HflX [Clostridiales bacterium]|jgi:GTP-binding protein HflX|nr:GTPase HflX [Clostridiales bacterium]
MYETETKRERFILVAVATLNTPDFDDGEIPPELSELTLLTETSGGEAAGYITQKREAAHPGHYLGKGKLDELKALIAATNADGVITDDELTPAQQRKLSALLQVKILDRTMVILDIFAGRAVSAEGKAQVELAQLRYRLSHLTGLGAQLSRQAGGGGFHGGGIGTRGPGEKKLETDRRHIRSRIDQLNRELKEIRENRAVLRGRRERAGVPVIAIVGYTNAGKSTLMNALTSAGVPAEDKLFATLDTATRRLTLPGGTEALLTDTVGFIHKLPHHLIRAFRATLEEVNFSDLLLHVVDYANPAYPAQMEVAYGLLQSLKCLDKPLITAFNKMDAAGRAQGEAPPKDERANASIPISARAGENIPALLSALETAIHAMRGKFTVLIPYNEGQWVSLIHGKCEVLSETHTESGTRMEVFADAETAGRLGRFIQNEKD